MSADRDPVIEARDATLNYRDGRAEAPAVRSVTFGLSASGFVGIMGPSGSGKSSLLYLLCGLRRCSAGDIAYMGRSLSSMSEPALTRLRRDSFGFVFQQPFLVGHLTAAENVVGAGTPGTRSTRQAIELLEELGLRHLAHRFPHQLSGGERQRVCVARALAPRPAVVFADEPTAALDRGNGQHVVELLTSRRRESLVIVVTHDPEMLAGADRVILMRDGSVVQ